MEKWLGLLTVITAIINGPAILSFINNRLTKKKTVVDMDSIRIENEIKLRAQNEKEMEVVKNQLNKAADEIEVLEAKNIVLQDEMLKLKESRMYDTLKLNLAIMELAKIKGCERAKIEQLLYGGIPELNKEEK